jgi:hypothetical protein
VGVQAVDPWGSSYVNEPATSPTAPPTFEASYTAGDPGIGACKCARALFCVFVCAALFCSCVCSRLAHTLSHTLSRLVHSQALWWS